VEVITLRDWLGVTLQGATDAHASDLIASGMRAGEGWMPAPEGLLGVGLSVGAPLGPLGVAAILGLAAVAALELWLARPDGPMKRGGPASVAATAARMIGILGLVALVLELRVTLEDEHRLERRIVVLVDSSRSMTLADAPTLEQPPTPRLQRALEAWSGDSAAPAAARAAWTRGGESLDLRSFGERVQPLGATADGQLAISPEERRSDLAAAFQRAQRPVSALAEGAPPQASAASAAATTRASDDASTDLGGGAEVTGRATEAGSGDVAAIVVISDGLVARDAAAQAHVAAVAKSLGIPVTTVAAGASAIVDVAISELRVAEFAFAENLTTVEVELVSHGLTNRRAQVELRIDGEPYTRSEVTLGDDGVTSTVRFEIVPDHTGQFVWEAVVSVEATQATTENDRRAAIVKVLRDKVRILHVAGRPDWDVRALRTLLRRDPNVELLSYYILRDEEDMDRADWNAPLSLIAFPVDQIFREQLGSFDLVILHNFDALHHGDYLGNIAQYVRDGGSLVIIGGDMGLAAAEYGALADLLPIDATRAAGIQRGAFEVQLSDAGRRHPLTAWLARDETLVDELPALDTFNPAALSTRAASIGGAVLLEHPSGAPLLAVAEPAKGRTLVLATGTSWRLGFAADLPLIDGARPFDKLWLASVRWLLREGDEDRLVMDLARDRMPPGTPLTMSLRTLNATYDADPKIGVSWTVHPVGAEDQPPAAQGELTTDDRGEATVTLPAVGPGAWVIAARRADADPSAPATRRVVLVDAVGDELASVDADPGTILLSELARETGGAFADLSKGDPLPTSIPLADPSLATREGGVPREVPIGEGWPILVLVLTAFSAEWILRRRAGAR
jgi:hypothetical protein